ncbi:MAG: T9SS type A sorting domain-containing protein [bacterium]
MKRSTLLFSLWLVLMSSAAFAQTNVRGWYADGQVWILWQTQQPFPQTYGIYKSNQPFTNTNQATAIGRPFVYEYLPGAFVDQTGNQNFRYRIPNPNGSIYTLQENEALFVETPLAAESAYYAIVEWGKTDVTPGVNRTQSPVSVSYDPVNDPVTCHLQITQTLGTGHKAYWYCLWELGRQEHWAGRPDFPVMANVFKNGMPAMFIVSEAIGMDTTGGKKIPATNWFHGGGNTAIQFTADKGLHFNIAPQQGISVSHNDEFPHLTIDNNDTLLTPARSLWFGWTKRHNPFDPSFNAAPGDTVINFTQRRILWINNWLIKHYNVDPDRIALQGYSMGSGGASALGKAFPNYFSTVCAFNNSFRAAIEPTSENILGTIAENLPTNLRRANGEVVRINEVFDMTTSTSSARDFPLFRTWAGKNDNNIRMYWGPDLVAQYRKADSLGFGVQISWDERFHTYETLGLHWINDIPATQQTFRDNLAYQENFRRNQSFPAFFNHRRDPQNNNPGTGKPGINNGDGDNWGTWGGWHNWDLQNIVDQPGRWEVTAWLTNNALFANDNSPHTSLIADLAIRKPQQFKPPTGRQLQWSVTRISNGQVLQSGTTTAGANDLVSITGITVFKDPDRVRIRVSDPTVAVESRDSEILPTQFSLSQNYPNPFWSGATSRFAGNPATAISFQLPVNSHVTLKVFDVNGREVATLVDGNLAAGNHAVTFALRGTTTGLYFYKITAGKFSQTRKAILMK